MQKGWFVSLRHLCNITCHLLNEVCKDETVLHDFASPSPSVMARVDAKHKAYRMNESEKKRTYNERMALCPQSSITRTFKRDCQFREFYLKTRSSRRSLWSEEFVWFNFGWKFWRKIRILKPGEVVKQLEFSLEFILAYYYEQPLAFLYRLPTLITLT